MSAVSGDHDVQGSRTGATGYLTATADSVPLGRQQLTSLLRSMLEIRQFELAVIDLYQAGEIRGGVHPYIGLEAIAVGAVAALSPGDMITSTHRGHGHCIARGLDLGRMMAEILGRSTGYCAGRGGSMHITAIDRGILGADAVVGGSLAIAVGAAYAASLPGPTRTVLAFFGDGAANQGTFHEALNLAGILRTPVVFLCENNQWAVTTPSEAVTAGGSIAARGSGYAIPGIQVDGNDVEAVHRAVAAALGRARDGHGPTLIEAVSYRMTGHSAFVTKDLRPGEKVQEWTRRDPIDRLRSRLLAMGVSDAELDALSDAVASRVAEAVAYAKSSPFPDPATALADVYAPASWNSGEAAG